MDQEGTAAALLQNLEAAMHAVRQHVHAALRTRSAPSLPAPTIADLVLLAGLTERQRSYLVLACDPRELTNDRIADHLGISRSTVEKHRRAVCHKLGVYSTVGLMHFALRVGLLQVDT